MYASYELSICVCIYSYMFYVCTCVCAYFYMCAYVFSIYAFAYMYTLCVHVSMLNYFGSFDVLMFGPGVLVHCSVCVYTYRQT